MITGDLTQSVGFGSGFGAPEFEDWMPRLEHFLKMDGFLPVEKPSTEKVAGAKQ